jgi:hypothetical protein
MAVAHVIGNVQARVLLTLFYFVVVPPFALIVKLATDPLGLRPPRPGSFWTVRAEADGATGRRQF